MTPTSSSTLPASRHFVAALVAVSLAFAGVTAASAQVVIDDFTTGQAAITAPPGGSSNAVTGGADIVGQNRNLTVLLVEGLGPMTAEVTGGALELAITDTTPDSRGDLLVVWDGNDHSSFDPTGLLGVDLTAGGTGGLRFDIAEAPAGASLVVTIYEDGMNVSRAGRVLPAIAAPASLYVDWSELVTAPDAVGPADLTNVGAITLQLSGTEIPRLAITQIAAVAPQVAASKVDRTAAGGAIPPAGVNPGDQIRYRVTVTNPGAGAEGVDFDDTLDANTAIVGGSVRTTPLARRDHYATVTGVAFDSVLESAPTLLANDVDPDGDSLVAVVATGQATTQGGTVDVDAAGDFVYTPPAGFQGVDSFTYTLQATAGDPTVDAAGNPIGAITGRAYVIIDRVAPELTGAGTVVFTEDGGPVAVAPALVVTDDDSPNLASATVTLTTVFDGADESLAAPAPSCVGLTVLGGGTDTLIITGSATLAAYQTCLRAVTYDNADQDPDGSDRSVDFQVSDGLLESNVETATVQVVPVNDAPVVTTSAGTSDFIEDGGAVVVDSALTVTDVDDTNIESAMVAITNVLDPGFETLAANAGSCAGLGIAGTTTLTITGSATKAAYQTCLRSVTYDNTDQDPNATDRSISFKVNDGDLDSDLAFKTVTVTPVNDPIVFTTNPIAYTTPGNTQLHVAGRTTPGVAAHADPLNALTKSGPTDVDGPAAPTVVPFAGATPNGTIDIIATGAFHYVPNVGFTGTDTFTVQVTDGADAVNLTIEMTVAQTVWYVCDETGADACVTGGVNPAGGDGRSTNAFETLTAAAAASVTPDDYIFVFEGNTVASPLAGGITLEDGEKLHGEGVGLTVTGFPQLVPAGTRPRIRTTTASTDVVSVPATATKRENVEIRGLDLEATGATSNAIDVTSSGALALIVRISENTIRGATAEGIDVNAGSTSTTQRLAIHDNALTAGGTALDVTRTAGTVTITAFDDNVVTGNSNGAGIVVTGPVTFDSIPGGSLDTVFGGTTVIGASGNPITGAGLTLTNVTGALDFADLDVFAGTSGVTITGTGAFTGAAGTRVTVPNGVAIIEAGNGPGVSASTMTLDFRLNALTVSASGSTGVNLVNVSDATVVPTAAHFSAPSSATIAGTTGTAFNVDGGNATISYAGTINNTSGRSVSVQNRTADTTTFTGGITDTGQGILLNANNAASTTNFQGGLSLTTGANAAFTATNGGVLNICDENPCNPGAVGLNVNTISTTSGTGLEVANTTIGANNLEFRSISAGTGAGSAGVGISLSNTGLAAGNGGLIVRGTGSAGSGGTIQHKTGGDGLTTSGIGIFLSSTKNATFNRMQLNDFDNAAIRGLNVHGFTLNDSVISGVNGTSSAAVGDGAIYFGTSNPGGANGLQGTGVIHNTKISGAIEHNVEFYNQSGNMNLTIDGTNAVSEGANLNSAADDTADCIIEENSVGSGADGIQIEMQSTATATIVIDRCLFRDNKSQAVQVSALNDSVVSLTIDESFTRKFDQGNEGFIVQNGGNADLTVMLSNNRCNNYGGTCFFVGQVAGNASASSELHASLVGNQVNQPTTATNHGIIVFLTANQVNQPSGLARINIANNVVVNNSTSGTTRGIIVDTPDTNTAPVYDVTVTGNSVSVGDNVAGVSGLVVQARQSSNACADISSNTVTFPNGTPAGVNGLRARQAGSAVFDLEQSVGCTGTAAAVLACRNPGATTEVLGTINVVAAGSCVLPNVP